MYRVQPSRRARIAGAALSLSALAAGGIAVVADDAAPQVSDSAVQLTANTSYTYEVGEQVNVDVNAIAQAQVGIPIPPVAQVTVTGLPEGTTYNRATNTITGAPTTAGTYTVTGTAKVPFLPVQTVSLQVTVVEPAAPSTSATPSTSLAPSTTVTDTPAAPTTGLPTVKPVRGQAFQLDVYDYLKGVYGDTFPAREQVTFEVAADTLPSGLGFNYGDNHVTGVALKTEDTVFKLGIRYTQNTADSALAGTVYIPFKVVSSAPKASQEPMDTGSSGSLDLGSLGGAFGSLGSS